MKIDRQKVFDKYDGLCAYCGVQLDIKRFQVDHIFPKCRSHMISETTLKHINQIENLNPACQKCNNFKGAHRLKLFRSELQKQVSRLKKTNAQFRRALRFGQVTITEKPIVFHFEKYENLQT